MNKKTHAISTPQLLAKMALAFAAATAIAYVTPSRAEELQSVTGQSVLAAPGFTFHPHAHPQCVINGYDDPECEGAAKALEQAGADKSKAAEILMNDPDVSPKLRDAMRQLVQATPIVNGTSATAVTSTGDEDADAIGNVRRANALKQNEVMDRTPMFGDITKQYISTMNTAEYAATPTASRDKLPIKTMTSYGLIVPPVVHTDSGKFSSDYSEGIGKYHVLTKQAAVKTYCSWFIKQSAVMYFTLIEGQDGLDLASSQQFLAKQYDQDDTYLMSVMDADAYAARYAQQHGVDPKSKSAKAFGDVALKSCLANPVKLGMKF